MRQRYLKAIVKAGPVTGTVALRRLSQLLADPLVADLDPAELEGVTGKHLARIAKSDWAGLAYLMSTAGFTSTVSRWARRAVGYAGAPLRRRSLSPREAGSRSRADSTERSRGV